MTRYVGTAPLTVVRTASGSAAYVYAGDPVPSGVPAADIKRLSSEGYIEAVPEPEVPEVAPKDGPPARNGSREDWAAYALTLGATPADLEGQTRDYIRDLADLARPGART